MTSQSRPMRLVLDTNVWLDYYLGFRPGSRDADELVHLAINRDIYLLFAIQSLCDVYIQTSFLLKKQFRAQYAVIDDKAAIAIKQAAISFCDNMSELATAVGADASDVWVARKHYKIHPDLEDNLVVAAALRAEADYLVTNDRALRDKAPVAALSSSDLLALLEQNGG